MEPWVQSHQHPCKPTSLPINHQPEKENKENLSQNKVMWVV
jgi:hypothetical protein